MLSQNFSLLLKRQKFGLYSHMISCRNNYDGPGKTTVTILNREEKHLMIDAYSMSGFRLNNNMRAYGPIAIFPTCVLSWHVGGAHDLNEKTLSLFFLVNPRPDVIIIGLGDRNVRIDAKKVLQLRKLGLALECLCTEDAIPTYNYLCSEGRAVGAALIPPDQVFDLTENDAFQQGGGADVKLRRK